MITANQLVAHAVGDYLLQSDWMANEKTKRSVAALAHVLTYMLPFLFLTRSPLALSVIVVTHFAIDRWRLAKYICWLKNFIGPRKVVFHDRVARAAGGTVLFNKRTVTWVHPWKECSDTGYHKDKPPWMSVWLMIIADNTLHVLCNGLALYYLTWSPW